MNESLSLAQRKRSIHRFISPRSVRNSPFSRFFFPFFSPLFSNNINRAKIKIKPRFEGSSKRRRMWNLCGRRDSKKKREEKNGIAIVHAHTRTHTYNTHHPCTHPKRVERPGPGDSSIRRVRSPEHRFLSTTFSAKYGQACTRDSLGLRDRSYNLSRRGYIIVHRIYIYTERERARKYGLTGNRWKEGKDGWTRGAIDREALICDTQRCCDYIQNFSHL